MQPPEDACGCLPLPTACPKQVNVDDAVDLREAIVASGRNLHNLAPSLVGNSVAFSKDKDVNRSLASLLLSPRWEYRCLYCFGCGSVGQCAFLSRMVPGTCSS